MKTEKFGVEKQILYDDANSSRISVTVTSKGVTADATTGKKIIKAGTPIGADADVLTNRQTKLFATNSTTDGAKSQGVILHDTDVTDGENSATMVYIGTVDLLKLDITLDDAAKAALAGKITFMKGAK